jgi:hypothetical protein
LKWKYQTGGTIKSKPAKGADGTKTQTKTGKIVILK